MMTRRAAESFLGRLHGREVWSTQSYVADTAAQR